jgi:DNA-binding transcriptional LysR family regulator
MTLRFTLRQLEYLVAVGETGSIALAAERLHVSSPSISAAIAQLEDVLGLQLFVRHHAKGLSPTQAGQQVLDQARRVLGEGEALFRLSGEISGNVQGNLKLGCLLTFAQVVVPRLRRGFEDRYPLVNVRQTELNQQEIFEALRNGSIDIALTYDLDIPEDLLYLPLAKLPPYVLLPDLHPLSHLPAISVDQLRGLPMILLDLPISSDYFQSLFRSAGFKPDIAERTRDLAVVRSLVANGYGYSIANVRPLSDSSPDGQKLCFVPLAGPVRPMVMGLALARGIDRLLTIRTFISYCQSIITDASVPGINLHRGPITRQF